MRNIIPSIVVLWIVAFVTTCPKTGLVAAKSSSTSRSSSGRPRTSSSKRPSAYSPKKKKKKAKASVSSRRRHYDEEEEEEEEEFDNYFPEEEEEQDDFMMEEEEEEEEILRPTKRRSSGSAAAAASRKPTKSKSRRSPPPSSSSSRRRRYEEEEEEEEDYDYYDRPPPRRSSSGRPPQSQHARGPPPRRSGGKTSSRRYSSSGGSRRSGSGGRVVPYSRQRPGTFTRGLAALRENLPDPGSVREAALSSISAAKETTSRLSANLYREVKGLTSSELEQVMLKATRPDDTPIKGKHVERLVGVTYQISARYDIYDAVLRKLWAKMAERDWRTKTKALYILHRFAADGAPEHQAALKARLRELRRTQDPKRKDKYFNSKQLLSGDTTPENVAFRAFLSRYAHYVLLRTQCFGGSFDEIGVEPSSSSSSSSKSRRPSPTKKKPLTSTVLRPEHLEAATLVLKAGTACAMKDGEESEHCAIAVERVASDLMGLCTAVAKSLQKALSEESGGDATDPAVLQKWCAFYSQQLLPQTKAMVKKTSPKLDAYGLFLPSRMGTTLSPELLQKGLTLTEKEEEEEEEAVAKETKAPKVAASKDDEEDQEEEEEEEEAVEEEEEEDVQEEEEEEEEEEEDAMEEEDEDEEEEDDEDFEYDEEYYDDE